MIEIFNDATIIYSVVILLTVVTLIVEIICIKATSLDVADDFGRVFLLIIIASICEWIGVVSPAFPPGFRWFVMMAKSLELMVAPIIPVSFALTTTRERLKMRHIIPLGVLPTR